MKKTATILLLIAGVGIMSCDNVKRKPGSIYMPDMTYSRAYETYIERDSTYFTTNPANPDDKIFYNTRPIPGTVMRGGDFSFTLPKDVGGDSTNYVAAKQVPSPLTSLSASDMKEAERIYLVNCAICHGTKLDGNGPLYKDGNGPYPAKPKNLITEIAGMPVGQMFYSITYGKNLMGPYGPQLSHHQRWMIIAYIKSRQAANAPAAPAGNTAAGGDSTATAKK